MDAHANMWGAWVVCVRARTGCTYSLVSLVHVSPGLHVWAAACGIRGKPVLCVHRSE